MGISLPEGKFFLALESFDPTVDTPVELLHVTSLDIMKHVFQTAKTHFLNEDMLDVLEKCFRSYDSKAFDRKLNSSMRLYKSFLGRGFKIGVQILPSVFKMVLSSAPFEIFRNENQVVYQVLSNRFTKLGELFISPPFHIL